MLEDLKTVRSVRLLNLDNAFEIARLQGKEAAIEEVIYAIEQDLALTEPMHADEE